MISFFVLKILSVSAHKNHDTKNTVKILATLRKSAYLCTRYPENNLFTLEKD